MILQAIFDKLNATATITAIIGTDPTKAFPGRAPTDINDSVGISQKVRPPFITFSIAGGESERHMGGDTGTVVGGFTFQFVADTYLGAETLFNTFRKAIDSSANTTWGSVRIQRATVDDPNDITNDPLTGAQLDWPTLESFVEVVYERTAASP